MVRISHSKRVGSTSGRPSDYTAQSTNVEETRFAAQCNVAEEIVSYVSRKVRSTVRFMREAIAHSGKEGADGVCV